MEIIISNSSDKPIYEQVSSQIKNKIMNGTLEAGEMLPLCGHWRKIYISV